MEGRRHRIAIGNPPYRITFTREAVLHAGFAKSNLDVLATDYLCSPGIGRRNLNYVAARFEELGIRFTADVDTAMIHENLARGHDYVTTKVWIEVTHEERAMIILSGIADQIETYFSLQSSPLSNTRLFFADEEPTK